MAGKEVGGGSSGLGVVEEGMGGCGQREGGEQWAGTRIQLMSDPVLILRAGRSGDALLLSIWASE